MKKLIGNASKMSVGDAMQILPSTPNSDMLKPLSQWICDTCGEVIEAPEAGAIEWLDGVDGSGAHSFKIVHYPKSSPRYNPENPRSGCYQFADDPRNLWLGIREFLDKDLGMARLLRFISPYPDESTDTDLPRFRSAFEYTDFLRRLLIPYYEEARPFISRAMHDGLFGGINEVAIFSPEALNQIIQEYSREE